jgi:hypothetical protein
MLIPTRYILASYLFPPYLMSYVTCYNEGYDEALDEGYVTCYNEGYNEA